MLKNIHIINEIQNRFWGFHLLFYAHVKEQIRSNISEIRYKVYSATPHWSPAPLAELAVASVPHQ